MPVYQYGGDNPPPPTSGFPGDKGSVSVGTTNPPQYDSVPPRPIPDDPGSQLPTYLLPHQNRDLDAEDRWVQEHVTSKGYVIDEVTGDVYDPDVYPPKIVDRMPDFYPAN